jgi:hypothetical protein
MRKVIFVFVIVFFGVLMTFGQIDSNCIKQIEGKFQKGKYLVLKMDGIPTMVEKLPGNLGSKTYCMININPDGNWKVKSVLGTQSDSTNILNKGDILLVMKLKTSKKSVQIYTRTDKAMPYDAHGRTSLLGSTKGTGTGHHANIFTFKLDKSEGCDTLLTKIEKYFDLYDTKEDIGKGKEIKLGMSMEEITEIMGEPEKKADLGTKVIFKYPDTIITFEEGKVTNIEFK